MYKLFFSTIILTLSACITGNYTSYHDPNYLNSTEFIEYNQLTKVNDIQSNYDSSKSNYDSSNITIAEENKESNYYDTDNYYDYSYSSRIRRFHRPMLYSNYYGGIYTDYYWYNNDPFYFGTNIYYGYNWHSPYYSYYSYSPYYHNYFYTPYFYGNYYSYYGNGYHYFSPASTYHYNSNRKYTTGHRGSLSTRNNLNTKSNTKLLSKLNTNSSTLNIREKNNYTTRKYKEKTSINNNRKNTKKGDYSNRNIINKNKISYDYPKSNSSIRNNTIKRNSVNNKNRNTKSRSIKPRRK